MPTPTITRPARSTVTPGHRPKRSRPARGRWSWTWAAGQGCAPDAVRNILSHLRPGAPVAAGGGKWAAPWMVAVNLSLTMLHAPYVRSFTGLRRPWHHLEQLIEDVHVREVALGSGYIVTGQAAPRIRT